MRGAHDRGLPDARVARDPVLDLFRVHVLAAADDHVALAPGQVQVAVRPEPPEVASVQPPVARGRREVPAPCPDLADAIAVRPVDDHFRVPHGPPDRAEKLVAVCGGAAVILRCESGDRAALGLRVALEQPDRGMVGQQAPHGDRADRRGPVGDGPPEPRQPDGPASSSLSIMAGPAGMGGPELAQRCPRVRGETRHGRDHRDPDGHRHHQQPDAAEVVELLGRGVDVVGPQLEQAGVDAGAQPEPVHPEPDRLRQAGRAGRMQHERDRIAAGREAENA